MRQTEICHSVLCGIVRASPTVLFANRCSSSDRRYLLIINLSLSWLHQWNTAFHHQQEAKRHRHRTGYEILAARLAVSLAFSCLKSAQTFEVSVLQDSIACRVCVIISPLPIALSERGHMRLRSESSLEKRPRRSSPCTRLNPPRYCPTADCDIGDLANG